MLQPERLLMFQYCKKMVLIYIRKLVRIQRSVMLALVRAEAEAGILKPL